MSRDRDLDPIPFVLTPKERDHAAWVRAYLERLRREQNERDRAKEAA